MISSTENMKLQGIAYCILLIAFSSLVYSSPIATSKELGRSKANVIEDLFFISEKEEKSIDEETLHRTVVEKIKSRILRGLNLKEKPKTHVPIPPLQTFRLAKTFWQNEASTAIQGNVRQQLKSEFLPSEIIPNTCFDQSGPPCVRFQIPIPSHISVKRSLSELWLYKKRGVTEFKFTQIIDEPSNFHLKKVLFTITNQSESEGWVRFDATQLLRKISLSVLDVEVFSNSMTVPIEYTKDQKPFLIVLSKPSEKSSSRFKRTAAVMNCTEGNTNCCRKEVYISFEDIGWNEWIVEPKGYNANICKGACTNRAQVDTHHAHVLISLLSTKNNNPEITDTIHCSPKTYKSLSIIYSDDKGVKVKVLPNMSVSECACS